MTGLTVGVVKLIAGVVLCAAAGVLYDAGTQGGALLVGWAAVRCLNEWWDEL